MNQAINRKILRCPKCAGSNFLVSAHKISCHKCRTNYKLSGDQVIIESLSGKQTQDSLDKLKSIFKKFPSLYYLMINLISPVYFDNFHLKKFLRKQFNNNELVAINLGSGNSNLSDRLINLDIFPYKNVDIVCNSTNIPLRNGSVDLVVNLALLEHVAEPEKTVKEIGRVLRKGGKVYCFFPFIQGFHASPYDFQRRTIEGLKELYRDFKCIEVRPGEGPTSGFLWILQDYIAILFSFGLKPLYFLVYFIVMLATFPLKFLDIFLIKNQFCKNIAGGFIFVGEKK